jgi:hypothetical protein
MPPKFAKKDRVKVLATRFDKEEVEEGELKFREMDGRRAWDLVLRSNFARLC